MLTATSAVCVTGLSVVDIGTFFTTFGQWVILALIQIDGLGGGETNPAAGPGLRPIP